ncbi:MAG: EpsG family protein [Butyrivibrio sp.]|nr:EpsG family protein [Butyrivibrio sp.]
MSKMLFYCAIGICIIFLCQVAIGLILPIRCRNNTIKVTWIIFIVALSIIAFWAEPSVSDDLYKHYKQIDDVCAGRDHSGMVVWRILLYGIGKTGEKGFLPALTVLIFGASIYCLISNRMKSNKLSMRTFSIYIIILFGGCSIFIIISGIRNVLVFSIWILAYYKLYKEGHKTLYYLACISLCLIHYSIIFVLAVQGVYELVKKKNKSIKIVLLLIMGLAPSVIIWLGQVLAKYSNLYVQTLVGKVDGYAGEEAYYKVNIWYIFLPISTLAIFIILLKVRKCKFIDNDDWGLISLYTYITLTVSITFPVLLDRNSMLICMMFCPIVDALYKSRKKIGLLMNILVVTCGIRALFYFNAMISHMKFYGIDFYHLLGRGS